MTSGHRVAYAGRVEVDGRASGQHRTNDTEESAMELIIMLLAPFPLGLLVQSRVGAYLAYIALHAFAFTFQSLMLVIEWAGGSTAAFGAYPEASSSDLLAYGAVNLVIYLLGLGLVALGQRVQSWRRSRRPGAVSLDPAR